MTGMSDEDLRVLGEKGAAAVVTVAVMRERARCARIVCGWCAQDVPMVASVETLKTWGDCHQLPDGGTATCAARLITGRIGTANADSFVARLNT